jgi:hypothetical protein
MRPTATAARGRTEFQRPLGVHLLVPRRTPLTCSCKQAFRFVHAGIPLTVLPSCCHRPLGRLRRRFPARPWATAGPRSSTTSKSPMDIQCVVRLRTALAELSACTPGGVAEGAPGARPPARAHLRPARATLDTDPTLAIANITGHLYQLQCRSLPPPWATMTVPPIARPSLDIVPRAAPPVVCDPQIRRAHPCRCPDGGHLPGVHFRVRNLTGPWHPARPTDPRDRLATRSLVRGLVETERAVPRGVLMTTDETSVITSGPTVAPNSLTGLPLMLTVGEAAAVLRISRTAPTSWRTSGELAGGPRGSRPCTWAAG